MPYKNNETVLVLVYARDTGRLLMLQRKDDADFWQSVTGSLEPQELPVQAAWREAHEELGFNRIVPDNADLLANGTIWAHSKLMDGQYAVQFEIFPQYRHKYAPDVTHCLEHWFLLETPQEFTPLLTEHLAFQWLEPVQAAQLTKSWNNALAIERYFLKEGEQNDTNATN